MRKSRMLNLMKEDVQGDLDLTPILSLMIVLIPMMLLSTAFVQMVMIETPLPQYISDAIAQAKDGEEQISVDLDVNGDRSAKITLTVNGRKDVKSLSSKPGDDHPLVDLSGLRNELIKIKQRHPSAFLMSLSPSPEVTFNEIVQVMDAARESGSKDINFEVINKDTGEKATTNLLFPEIVFGNLAEG